jgi:hypothetical protein
MLVATTERGTLQRTRRGVLTEYDATARQNFQTALQDHPPFARPTRSSSYGANSSSRPRTRYGGVGFGTGREANPKVHAVHGRRIDGISGPIDQVELDAGIPARRPAGGPRSAREVAKGPARGERSEGVHHRVRLALDHGGAECGCVEGVGDRDASAQGAEEFRLRCQAGQADHLVARCDERADERGPEGTGRTGDEHAHGSREHSTTRPCARP